MRDQGFSDIAEGTIYQQTQPRIARQLAGASARGDFVIWITLDGAGE